MIGNIDTQQESLTQTLVSDPKEDCMLFECRYYKQGCIALTRLERELIAVLQNLSKLFCLPLFY